MVALNPKENQVIVGSKEDLARNILTLKECNWLFEQENNDSPIAVDVKFRSTMKPTTATLHMNKNGAEIHLDNPQYGISAGQAAVCYINDRVIGGGWITSTTNA